MDRRYRFERMHLLRSPGFVSPPFGPLTDFSSALNILYGPNGIGKSTLIGAMRSLLAQREAGRTIDAEATVKSGDSTYALCLVHGRLSQLLAATGEPISLPGRNDELVDTYFFGLHELLSDVGDNRLFVERVHSEMQGGINLEAARQHSKAITKFPTSGIGESKEEAHASKEVDRIKGEIAKNSDLFDRIAEITALLGAEPELRRAEHLLSRAREYRSKSDEAAALQQQLRGYDERLASFSATTATELATLHARYDGALTEHGEAEEAVAAAEKTIEAAHLADRFLANDQVTEEIEDLIEAVVGAQRAYEEAKTKRLEAEAALTVWEGELSWLVGSRSDKRTLQAMVQTLSSIAQRCEPLRIRVATTALLLRTLGKVDDNVETEIKEAELQKSRVERLIALTARRGEGAGETTHPLWWAPIALFALSAILALLWQPAALIGAAVATAVAFFVRSTGAGRRNREREKEIEQVRHLIGEYDSTHDWSLEGLSTLLGSIAGEIGKLVERRAKNERIAQAVDDAQEAAAMWDAWRVEWKEASSALHLQASPSLEGAEFFNFSARLLSWLDYKEEAAKRVVNQKAAATTLKAAQEKLRSFCGLESIADDQLIKGAEALNKRIAQIQSLIAGLAERRTRLSRAEGALNDGRDALTGFYTAHGFFEWDRDEVVQLHKRWEAYAALVERHSAAVRDIERYSEEERSFGDEHDEVSLALLLEEVGGKLEVLSSKKIEQGKLDERYQTMSDSPVLEQAVYAHQSAVSRLEEHRRAAVRGRVIQALYERIKEESQSRYQPQVVKSASCWLSKITNGRYTMGVGEENFIAIDSLNNRPYQLTELSSGTRIQLLFSIRMAFLALLEEGREQQLPIFFDELMANSDDERSIAIAEAIASISETRQVFYATAQYDEVEKLKSVVETPIKIFDLEAIIKKTAIERHPFVATTPRQKQLIDPIEDYNAYALALGVTRPRLFEPVGRLHSWYLATDSEALYALLGRGLVHCGQSANSDRIYQKRFKLLEEAALLAQRGRAPLMDITALSDESLPISREVGYFRQIQDFLTSAEHSGNDLIEALEGRTIRGMREPMRVAFIEWLLEKGYATDQSPLEEEEIMALIAINHPDLALQSSEYVVVERYLQALELL